MNEIPYIFMNADIGLSHKRGLLGTLLDLGAAIGAIPPQLHHHAFMIYYSFVPGPWPEKGWWVVESVPPEVSIRLLTSEDVEKSDFYRVVNLSEEQRQAVILWALGQKGKPYGHWGNIQWALSILWSWLKKLLGLPVVQYAPNCTNLVASAFRSQGADLAPGKPANEIWPTSDIADSELTVRVL